ncbi:hypothetical protein TMSI_26550 [Klebsiella quasipneumoniae]|nr:hypothetical protein TMSI_26550 [Klebsiella quasipneumoniae]GKP92490.1 hypothetical protein NUKP71_31780 [Klebsiella quasipneumoniae]
MQPWEEASFTINTNLRRALNTMSAAWNMQIMLRTHRVCFHLHAYVKSKPSLTMIIYTQKTGH